MFIPTSRPLVAAIALIAVLTLVGATSAPAQTITVDNVAEMAANAKTAADHTALATYFREQAKVAEDGARKHRAMLTTGPSNKTVRSVWDTHCRRLVKGFEEQAAAYEDLAKEQDVLAKHVSDTH